MGSITVTNTFSASTTISSSQMNTNFSDLENGTSDGTKDFSISALTAAGVSTLNGNVTLGSSSSKTLTINAALSSTIAIGTNNTYDIGAATLALAGIYLGAPSSRSTRLTAHQSLGASNTLVLPNGNGSANQFLKTDGSGNLSWGKTAPTIQTFTSGTGTYTTASNVLYIRVRMVGGGGGGGGSGTGGGTTGGSGGNSTFGTTLLVANGGTGAGNSGNNGGVGGTASLGTGPIGTTVTGGGGAGGSYNGASVTFLAGGNGGASPFGGAGQGGSGGVAGGAASANSGSGGGGGGGGSTVNENSGTGGGAGGFVDALISTPSATYAYAIGAAGSAGAAGTSGFAGAVGAAGYIEVAEYYQ